MTNEHQSVEQLVAAAAAMSPELRSGFLDRACPDDPDLRSLVAKLVQEHDIPDSFLETPLLSGQISEELTSDFPAVRAPSGPPRFSENELIAGRFQVVRFIARGGMGEVYEVKDSFLHGTPVALKIIRPEIAADPDSSWRFEQEVMLARKVTHRTLCPIYDISRCEKPAPPFLFLTMKLLAGESLDSQLKKTNGIPLAQGLEIYRQLVEGIDAIHKAGIVHRDIKPSNVMLEPAGIGICVTIMDFGLARLSEGGPTISRVGMVAGTPGYLAPELIRGATPSEASDLYALGVVLHQVLTGHAPAPAKSGRGAVVASALYLSKAPAPLVDAVADFLSEDSERRCRAFQNVLHFFNLRIGPPKPVLLTRRNFALGSVAAVGCLGAGTVWKWPEIYDRLHPLPVKRFVALLNWPPPSDARIAPVLLGLIDSMVNALSRAEAFDHNFYVACQNYITEMKTPAQVNDVCESLGANLILATSGKIVPDGISISLRVLSATSSKVLRSRDFHVPSDQQFTLVERTVRAASELLNVASLPANRVLNQVGTENPEALAAFQAAEALMKEPNNSGLDAAIEQYKVAVDADPHFAKAHARLAAAYMRVFVEHYDETSVALARANAQTALDLDPESSEAYAMFAMIAKETGDLPQALRQIALALAPDPANSRLIIYQAQIYFALHRWQDAEDALRRVLKARPNFWLAYLELGNTYSYQGKFQLALQAFQASGITAPRNAQPFANAAQMFFLLGHLDQADAAISRSMSLAPLSWAFEIRSDIMLVRSKLPEAIQAAAKASELSPEDITPWLRMADIYVRMKHHKKEAGKAYVRALASMVAALKTDPNDKESWMLMALCQIKTGDKASAESSLRKAEDTIPLDIYSMLYKTRILELLGRREDALATLATCMTMGATIIQIKSINDLDSLLSDPRGPSLFRSAADIRKD